MRKGRPIMLAGLLAAFGFGAAAQAEDIDVREAHARAAANQTLIVDVRTPREWAATGAPEGAARINLFDEAGADGFVAKVLAAVNGDRDAPVALICRTGVRSTEATKRLEAAGFTAVANVRGGVAGARDATGWFDEGLPVER